MKKLQELIPELFSHFKTALVFPIGNADGLIGVSCEADSFDRLDTWMSAHCGEYITAIFVSGDNSPYILTGTNTLCFADFVSRRFTRTKRVYMSIHPNAVRRLYGGVPHSATGFWKRVRESEEKIMSDMRKELATAYVAEVTARGTVGC